ncbi:hypothetical protein Fmac_007872 [Flemingia macrophylla]|uniref:Uncharacterized protein n=1 Tax=Flemingia macrophylla TaxID=520843 RepID=A0ABD1MWM2_9FABA
MSCTVIRRTGPHNEYPHLRYTLLYATKARDNQPRLALLMIYIPLIADNKDSWTSWLNSEHKLLFFRNTHPTYLSKSGGRFLSLPK